VSGGLIFRSAPNFQFQYISQYTCTGHRLHEHTASEEKTSTEHLEKYLVVMCS